MAQGETGTHKDPSGLGPGAGVVLALLVFAVIQGVLVRAGLPAIFDGALWDPDSYMWLNRVRHLRDSGAWFDPVYPRLNPPEGFAQHWTRPLDLLLLAGAWPLGLLLGFEDALYWWAVVISPILLGLSLLALVWMARPVLPRDWLWLTGLLFVCQPGVAANFMLGRPDHHGLLILLFLLSIGLTLRLLIEPRHDGRAALAGLLAALALWVSVQALLVVALTVASLGLYWILGDRRLARPLLIHAAALCAGLTAALLIERGPGRFLDAEFDTLSIVHLAVFALNLGYWSAVGVLERRGALPARRAGRLACAAVGAAGLGAGLWIALPGLFESPMATLDPLYRTVHLERVKELQPVIDLRDPIAWSWRRSVAMPLVWLGIALPAVPYLGTLVLTRSGPERRAWVCIGLTAAVFVPLAVFQLRWLSFAGVGLVLPYAALAGAALTWLARRDLAETMLRVARPAAIAGFCLWFFLPLAVAGGFEQAGDGHDRRSACPLRPLAGFLSDPAGLGAAPKRLLAFIDFGPELLYRTPHALYAIPNHRVQPGFTAGYRILAASDFAEARRRLRDAGVELIVICPGSIEEAFYRAEGGARSLYRALSAGASPAFLAPLALPETLARFFKVFAVGPQS